MCLTFLRAIGPSKGAKVCVTGVLTPGIPTYLICPEVTEPMRLRIGDSRRR